MTVYLPIMPSGPFRRGVGAENLIRRGRAAPAGLAADRAAAW